MFRPLNDIQITFAFQLSLIFAFVAVVSCGGGPNSAEKIKDTLNEEQAQQVATEMIDSVIFREEGLSIDWFVMPSAELVMGKSYQGYEQMASALKEEMPILVQKVTKQKQILAGGSWTYIPDWENKEEVFRIGLPVTKGNKENQHFEGGKALRVTLQVKPGKAFEKYARIKQIMNDKMLKARGELIETYKAAYAEGTPQGLGTTIIFIPLK